MDTELTIVEIRLPWNIARTVLEELQHSESYHNGSRNMGIAVEEITIALLKAENKSENHKEVA